MNRKNTFIRSVCFISVSSLGGFLISLTDLSIGWMIGTFLAAAFLSYWRPSILRGNGNQKGMPKYWLYMGQFILGIHLGQKLNLTFLHVFKENWLAIILMLLLSIIFSLLSGLVLWKYSNTDMMTSFFGTAPGGLSAMPGIAEEAGANTAVVSIIQTMRVFLVILMIPLVASFSASTNGNSANHVPISVLTDPEFKIGMLLWTFALIGFAYAGYRLIKYLRVPAPWLIGSMVGVAIAQSLGSFFIGSDIISWWPHEVIILSQIMIAASIGSRFQKSMFIGLKRTIMVSFLSTVGLIFSMVICAILVVRITEISLITSILAFAPGGIAEMTTTSVVLHGDSTFVVAVQVLRILIICVILPQFFRLLNYLEQKKHFLSKTSA
ncbi:AbrB family transcriptional regulator [Neobacillus sp. SuZ13]|uniref:AbrB family transcriptional regulator n=1 Tax=Neobacillus sp. SuZ13 TaxID=3047875 RepID=UPI0024C0247A|nr:AbrB family transcriptional regulator [Neobacillus sp. SuZ13]WHY68961.1 AbrB family transcriptional regulator [Neobacillus sp. SuZ13]